MNAIDKKLAEIKKRKSVGLMTHVVVGYPNLDMTVSLVKTMAEAGADMVELQIPFSDPIADGPTIMKACEKVLAQGVKVKDAFVVAKKLSRVVDIPLLFMAYYNTVFKYGVSKFCKDAGSVGISGLIVPDIPLEEEDCERLAAHSKKNGLHLIRVVSPASTESRLRKNAIVAEGFVYCSARQGITGARKTLAPELVGYLKKARTFFNVPLAVGFGISKPEHLKKLVSHVDIAVVGSAIIDAIQKSASKSVLENVRRFMVALRGA